MTPNCLDTCPGQATHSLPRADVPPPSSPGSQRKHGRLRIEVTTQRLLKSRGVRTAASLHLAGGGGALRPPRHLLSTGTDPPGTWLDSSGKAVGCIVIFRGGNITALKPHNLLPHPAGARAAGGSAVPAAAPHPGPAPAWGSAAARAGLEGRAGAGQEGPCGRRRGSPAPRRPPAGCQGRVPTRADRGCADGGRPPGHPGALPCNPGQVSAGGTVQTGPPIGSASTAWGEGGPPSEPWPPWLRHIILPSSLVCPISQMEKRRPREVKRPAPVTQEVCPPPPGRSPPQLAGTLPGWAPARSTVDITAASGKTVGCIVIPQPGGAPTIQPTTSPQRAASLGAWRDVVASEGTSWAGGRRRAGGRDAKGMAQAGGQQRARGEPHGEDHPAGREERRGGGRRATRPLGKRHKQWDHSHLHGGAKTAPR